MEKRRERGRVEHKHKPENKQLGNTQYQPDSWDATNADDVKIIVSLMIPSISTFSIDHQVPYDHILLYVMAHETVHVSQGLTERDDREDQWIPWASRSWEREVEAHRILDKFWDDVPGIKIRQIETDEIYIGIDREGSKFVIPVQAKGSKDFLSLVQIEQDISMCSSKFPDLKCRAVGIKRDTNDIISMFEYTTRDNEVSIERRASFTIHRL